MFSWYYLVIVGYLCLFEVHSLSTPCTTPNGEEAYCKSLRECTSLKNAFISEDPVVQKFFSDSESACGGEGYVVCCGTFGNYTEPKREELENGTTEKQESRKEYALRKLLPTKRHCGMQHTDDYFYNKTETSVDEFPWLILVYYDDTKRGKRLIDKCLIITWSFGPCPFDNKYYKKVPALPEVTYKCTGVLISNRYALTSGSCGSDRSMKVALGQYEENKEVTCIKTDFGEEDCTRPAVNVTVEEQIISPDSSLLLLRLERKIQYTDFIRPICLPMNETIRPNISDIVVTSGWGYENIDNNVRAIKKRIRQNITDSEVCENESSSDRLCATLVNENNFVCKSDRGGPVMYKYKHKNWYVEGLVNVDKCVNDTVQGVRITPELVDWILENMED